MNKSEIDPIIEKVMDKHKQTDIFSSRFEKFYENTINNNLGSKSLQRLIEDVDLPEEEQINES